MIQLLHGDCIDVLKTLEPDSIHACMTDPPYHLTSMVQRLSRVTGPEIGENFTRTIDGQSTNPFATMARGFMGKQWDGGNIAFQPETWRAVYRVLKPGAHLLAFGGTRTYHRLACAIEDAGFEIRDQFAWMYGSGFPKSRDASKAIDQELGAQREVVGSKFGQPGYRLGPTGEVNIYGGALANGSAKCEITAPATPEAAQWSGWGTAVKPAWEPLVLARKPMVGNLAQNLLKHGTGAINIDACRVPSNLEEMQGRSGTSTPNNIYGDNINTHVGIWEPNATGRWPANVAHDGSDEVEAAFAAFGETGGGHWHNQRSDNAIFGKSSGGSAEVKYDGKGTASRFFYTAKADKDDRAGSKHPTVKPVDMIRYYIRMITPPGGTVLDCFAGSGTTGEAAMLEGFDAILIERDEQSVADIRHRIKRWSGQDMPLFAETAD